MARRVRLHKGRCVRVQGVSRRQRIRIRRHLPEGLLERVVGAQPDVLRPERGLDRRRVQRLTVHHPVVLHPFHAGRKTDRQVNRPWFAGGSET